jgi:hypothetical protein
VTSTVPDELLRRAVQFQERPDGTDGALVDRVPGPWATSLQATCDCLSSRGVVDNVQRRHQEDELSQAVDTQLPGELAQLVVVTRMLLEQGLITDQQLEDRMSAVRERFTGTD